ncbi:uncharacterized protein LOC125381668 isoform X2 [Haliotis rufescens]|uniref:uncharacterized protein LOC125381668 isoform X2 n=1 Tax=Haliotis rufescens TaxID=6454 RepID=UPI00201F3DB5|nr:uncharacterized protein LOC125381668 isoform X2 [Haliotis rufescens]
MKRVGNETDGSSISLHSGYLLVSGKMATSQKLTEHFLTCTICTEVFDKPCTLVCNHTFCRKCVVNYTKTRPEAISAKSLLCPFCSKMTKVSAPERPVEEWADDVKPSFVIQGLLDSFGPGSKDTTHCSYCKEEGETTPATSWCSVCDDALCELCIRVHRRIPSSRHHHVVDLSGETKVRVKRKVDDLQLGGIDVLYEGVLDLKATPVLQDTINVRVAGDTSGTYPTDVTVLVVNGTDIVVVTENNNHSMKSFYTRNKKQSHSRLSLSGGYPYGITKLKDNQVAVTVPGSRQIVTVQVNPDLVLLSTITTSKRYYGITSLTPSTLAAGSHSPPCVDILDMTGHVLKSVCPGQPSRYMLKNPLYLCTTRTGNILVSDWGSTCVVCLTPEGDEVFTYSPTGDTALKDPHGITSTSTGDILVTDYHLHRVLHLTESGQFVKNILTSQDGVQYPRGVCVGGRGRMYVCRPDSVKVFTCK